MNSKMTENMELNCTIRRNKIIHLCFVFRWRHSFTKASQSYKIENVIHDTFQPKNEIK